MASKKESFMNEISSIIQNQTGQKMEDILSPDALDFWNGLQMTGDGGRPRFTSNGKIVLEYMQNNKDPYNNLFKAKDIGEQLGISSRTVSGGMRKLVTDGYVEKLGENPVIYSVTIEGLNIDLDQSDEDNN